MRRQLLEESTSINRQASLLEGPTSPPHSLGMPDSSEELLELINRLKDKISNHKEDTEFKASAISC